MTARSFVVRQVDEKKMRRHRPVAVPVGPWKGVWRKSGEHVLGEAGTES
jgi:hypothetical protein